MAADLGTKPLSATRMSDLKVICGMSVEVEERSAVREGTGVFGQNETMQKAIKLLVMASLIQSATSQGDDGEAHQPRREDDTTMWMLVAMYTFLIVVAVNVFQWVFSTWRTVAENVESGLQESGAISQYQRYRILAAQRTLREAERRRNEAEDALFQEIVQAYHPNSPPSRQSRDSRSRSSMRRRSSPSRRRSSEASGSGRYSPTEEASPRTERRRNGSRSQSTRNYASRSEEEEDQRERFNVFGHGEEEAPEHHEGEHETPEERGVDLGDRKSVV